MIKLEPTRTYLYVQLKKPNTTLELPEGIMDPTADIIVLATGPDVEQIVVGDSLVLRPQSNLLGVDEEYDTALVDASAVIAIRR